MTSVNLFWPYHIHNKAVKWSKWYKSNINTHLCKWVIFHHSFPTTPRSLLFCLSFSLGLWGLLSPLPFDVLSILSSKGPVGRLGWVWIPPPRPVVFLAQLSSKAFSSHTVFTGWVSTGSRQYFARLRANRGSRDSFAHGHRQSGVHRIDWGNFPIRQWKNHSLFHHPLLRCPVWHQPCPKWHSWCGHI